MPTTLRRNRMAPVAFLTDEEERASQNPSVRERPVLLSTGRGDVRISKAEAAALAKQLAEAIEACPDNPEPAALAEGVYASNNAAYAARVKLERSGVRCCTRKIREGEYRVFALNEAD